MKSSMPVSVASSSWSLVRMMMVVGILSVLCSFIGRNTVMTVTAKRSSAPATNKNTARNIKILNESGSRVEIHWIHPETREASLMSSPNVMNGASFPLNSYVGHEFEVRELPSVKSGVCGGTEDGGDQTCKSKFFEVSENDDQSEYSTVFPTKICMFDHLWREGEGGDTHPVQNQRPLQDVPHNVIMRS